ncbi:hypothetical protein [Burkholderia vietnamiensis]|uniref:hypothetical protein n=1 Tax=Burkholderia vietnamiensis TaxID=60552 RepID=UPI001CF27225|nr:hypothetical protein [Burkholderia vietnamiensis]MCA8287556.1 hypothetical protein [Burkholderia vietnamiensis]
MSHLHLAELANAECDGVWGVEETYAGMRFEEALATLQERHPGSTAAHLFVMTYPGIRVDGTVQTELGFDTLLAWPGLDLDAQDSEGETALMRGSRLLTGRNPGTPSGEVPYFLAKLVRAGASPSIVNAHGKTALDLLIAGRDDYLAGLQDYFSPFDDDNEFRDRYIGQFLDLVRLLEPTTLHATLAGLDLPTRREQGGRRRL